MAHLYECSELQSHERRAIRFLEVTLPDEYIILAGIPGRFAGREIDTLVMGRRLIICCELKDHVGNLTATVVGPWLRNGIPIRDERNFFDQAEIGAKILKSNLKKRDPIFASIYIDSCVICTNQNSTLSFQDDTLSSQACLLAEAPAFLRKREKSLLASGQVRRILDLLHQSYTEDLLKIFEAEPSPKRAAEPQIIVERRDHFTPVVRKNNKENVARPQKSIVPLILILTTVVFFVIWVRSQKNDDSVAPRSISVPVRTEVVDNFAEGRILGQGYGIQFVSTSRGQAVLMSRGRESRIEYPYSTGFPRSGTLELRLRVDRGYAYQQGDLTVDPQKALVFTTDIQGGDVTHPGSAWLYVSNDGTLEFHVAGVAYEAGWGQQYRLYARRTAFRFGQWNTISVSFGRGGMMIALNGNVVAARPDNAQTLGGGGNHQRSLGQPTIGESISHFWPNNRFEGGFEGLIGAVRYSNNSADFRLHGM